MKLENSEKDAESPENPRNMTKFKLNVNSFANEGGDAESEDNEVKESRL